jgi:hypothetical protein
MIIPPSYSPRSFKLISQLNEVHPIHATGLTPNGEHILSFENSQWKRILHHSLDNSRMEKMNAHFPLLNEKQQSFSVLPGAQSIQGHSNAQPVD